MLHVRKTLTAIVLTATALLTSACGHTVHRTVVVHHYPARHVYVRHVTVRHVVVHHVYVHHH